MGLLCSIRQRMVKVIFHKRTWLTLLLLLCIKALYAQALIAVLFGGKIKNQHIKLGVLVGATGSWITETESQQPRIGVALGAYTAYVLNEKWEVCMYIVAKSPKGGKSINYENSFIVPEDTALVNTSFNRWITYINAAPVIRYKLTPSFALALGPQVAARARSTDIYEHSTDQGKLSYHYNSKDYIHRLDAGAVFDAQYTMMKGKGMRLNLQYYWGLTNLYKDNPAGLRGSNQQFILSVGIPIGTTGN